MNTTPEVAIADTMAHRPRTAQRYSSYKAADLPYIDRLPSHWTATRLRFLSRLNPSKREVSALPDSTEVSFVPMDAVGENGGIRLDKTRYLGAVEQGYTFFRDGDIVCAKITPCFENYKGAVAKNLINGIGFGTTELHVLRPCRSIHRGFLWYATLCEEFRRLGTGEMYGAGGQKRVPESFIQNFRVPLPPLPEQRAIAAFLDEQTQHIDALIEKNRHLLDLLAEQRTALITQAVTKGLDPSAPMKDSGVDWLGEVPGETVRLKFLTSFVTSGSRGWADHYSDDGDSFLRIGNLSRFSVDLDLSDIQHVTPPDGAEVERTAVRPGDVLISVTAYIGAIGVIPDGLGVSYVNQHLALVRPRTNHIEPRWLAYVLFSRVGQVQLHNAMNGGTKQGLGLDDVKNIRIVVPSLTSQRSTLALLDEDGRRTASTIATVNTAIARLTEYRQALISSAVTGRIDVSEIVSSLEGVE